MLRGAVGAIDSRELGAVMAQEVDDLDLPIACPSRAARAGRLRCEMKRCRATCPQAAVGSGSDGEQAAYGAHTPCAYSAMERRGSAALGMVHECAVLDEQLDDGHLGIRIPDNWDPAGGRPPLGSGKIRVRVTLRCGGPGRRQSWGVLRRGGVVYYLCRASSSNEVDALSDRHAGWARREVALPVLVAVCVLCSTCRRAPPRSGRAESPPGARSSRTVDIEWAGCSGVRRGPVCELGLERRLTIWIDSPNATTWEIRADGRALRASREPDIDGGTRLTVDVPPRVRRIALDDPKGRSEWTLATGDAPETPEIDRLVRLGRTGRYAEALAGLDSLRARATPGDEGRIDAAVGRMALALGNLDRAEPALRSAIAAARTEGRLADVVRDGAALVWALVMLQQRFADARDVLEVMKPSAEQFPEGTAWIAYHAGLLAAHTGDVRTAFRNYREALRIARRLQQASLAENATMEVAVQLVSVGRADEALELLRALPSPADPCARASLTLNIEWTLNRKAARPAADPRDNELAEAAALVEASTRSCPDPHRRMLSLIHVAERSLERGDVAGAEPAVKAIRAAAPLRDVRLNAWRLDVLGHWSLGRHEPALALAAFEEQSRLSRGAGLEEEEFRGEVGAGRAFLALRRPAAGISRLRAALELLDARLREIPLGDGRGSFLDGHDDGVRALVDALVEGGEVKDALRVARWMRTAELVQTTRINRLQNLGAEARRRWDEAIGRYQRIRRDIEGEAERDWELPSTAVSRVRAERQARAEEARVALDEAYRWLGGGSGSAPPRLSAPAAGEVMLAFFPARDGWYAFGATSASTRVHRFADAVLSSLPEAGTVLAHFLPELAKARRVRLLPYGASDRVDWHFAPLAGRPLVSALEVVYGLDLATETMERPVSAPSGPPRALVVGDPSGDLPASLREAELVARQLSDWQITRLSGRGVTRAALLERMPLAYLFHYAGHADVATSQDLTNALVLGGSARVELGDLMAAHPMPHLVVLSACEAAGTVSRYASLMGLAQAFVAAGSGAVVAPTRLVSDGAAAIFFTEFYRVFGHRTEDLERQFSEAYRSAVLKMVALEDSNGSSRMDSGGWRSFRMLVP